MEDTFLPMFPQDTWEIWQTLKTYTQEISEIRIRLGMPIIVVKTDGEWFLGEKGLSKDKQKGIVTGEMQMNRYLNHFCHDSLYAFQEELKNGYITVPGGHRIGVAGQVMLVGGEVVGMKYISCINIRLAHQIKGVADRILPFLYERGRLLNTLIVSPPGCGKTTLLRDMVRQISNGNAHGEGLTVSVIDERSEIAGCYLGNPQNDIGIRTDVLDGCPKEKGLMLMLRSMSPRVVAVDELGGREDEKALHKLSSCGCKVIATVHGENIEDLRGKPGWENILDDCIFERYILLEKRSGKPGIAGIYNKKLQEVRETF